MNYALWRIFWITGDSVIGHLKKKIPEFCGPVHDGVLWGNNEGAVDWCVGIGEDGVEVSHNLQGFSQSHAVRQNSTRSGMFVNFVDGLDRRRIHELYSVSLVCLEDSRQVSVNNDGRGVTNGRCFENKRRLGGTGRCSWRWRLRGVAFIIGVRDDDEFDFRRGQVHAIFICCEIHKRIEIIMSAYHGSNLSWRGRTDIRKIICTVGSIGKRVCSIMLERHDGIRNERWRETSYLVEKYVLSASSSCRVVEVDEKCVSVEDDEYRIRAGTKKREDDRVDWSAMSDEKRDSANGKRKDRRGGRHWPAICEEVQFRARNSRRITMNSLLHHLLQTSWKKINTKSEIKRIHVMMSILQRESVVNHLFICESCGENSYMMNRVVVLCVDHDVRNIPELMN